MTDKERLKEFKKQIEFLDDSADMDDFGRFVDTLQNMYEDGEFHWIIRYLKEQAERVQELEETVEDYKTVNKELHLRGRKVRKQNKRYREAIIEALHVLKTLPSVAPRLYIISILDKALESDNK